MMAFQIKVNSEPVSGFSLSSVHSHRQNGHTPPLPQGMFGGGFTVCGQDSVVGPSSRGPSLHFSREVQVYELAWVKELDERT